jgi:putative membrane protein
MQTLIENRYKFVIGSLSVLVPVVVAILLFMPNRLDLDQQIISYLPGFHALVNSATALVLLAGVYFIKKGNVKLHKQTMLVAFVLGCLFLVSYILYHSSTEPVLFGDLNNDGVLSDEEKSLVGTSRIVYLSILLPHIVLAAAALPFVLLALFYGLNNNHVKHRKMVKFAFPLWFIVSVTGVIVYFMLSPYYPY